MNPSSLRGFEHTMNNLQRSVLTALLAWAGVGGIGLGVVRCLNLGRACRLKGLVWGRRNLVFSFEGLNRIVDATILAGAAGTARLLQKLRIDRQEIVIERMRGWRWM